MASFITFPRIAAIAFISLIAFAAHYLHRVHRVESVFWTALNEMPRASIENIIGQPDSVALCGEYLWWGSDQFNPPKNNGECASWVRYNFFLEAYAFGYSESGHLVSKYRYFSE